VSLGLRVPILHGKILLSPSGIPSMLEVEGTVFLQNFSNHLPGKAASRPRRRGSATKVEREPQISCKSFILSDLDRCMSKAVENVINLNSLSFVMWIN
jgi:hypothetical protein